jgi:DNA-binding LacI/PurR family transcriptional regulator
VGRKAFLPAGETWFVERHDELSVAREVRHSNGALHELGVRVPDDIAVVGWDDIEEASYSTPTLTSIAPDKVQITTRAIDGLLASINKSAVVLEDVTCPFELKIRESTGG